MDVLEIPMSDTSVAEAHVARPAGGGRHPGVLFFMDAIGLRPQIAEMCQRIADWGYVVLAPNVFHREGTVADLAPEGDLREPGEREAFFALAMPRVAALTTDLAELDLPVYLAALRDLPDVTGDGVAATGYCMGARLAVRSARLDRDVVAVGGFHGGGLVTDGDDSPHLGLPRSQAEFLFRHADQDRSMPAEAIAELGAALAEAGLVASNEVYPGAAHGYTMADTASYDEAAAERHFVELEALFERTFR